MSRATPIYFSGNISGTNNVVDLQLVLESTIKSFQSAGVDAWEEFDVLTATPGTRDVVFRSKGDRDLVSGAGDARLFVRVKQVNASTLDFFLYQDWSTSGSGSGTGQQGGSTNGTWTSLNATTDMSYWGVSNDHEYILIMKQVGTFWVFWFSGLKRTHIPEAGRGVGFTTDAPGAPTTDTVASITDSAGTTTLVVDSSTFVVGDVGRTIRVAAATNVTNSGDFVIAGYTNATTVTYANAEGVTEASSPANIEMDVEYSLDRDLTGGVPANGALVDGQKCWIYPISDTAARDTTAVVLATVVSTATGPNKLTLVGVENAYASGSIVGLDPCPMAMNAQLMGTFVSALMPNNNAGGAGGARDVNPVIKAATEANLDPGSEGLYYGSEVYIEDSNTSTGGLRGTPELISFWAVGAQTDGDRMQENYLTTDAASWKIFPSILSGSFALAFGKGVPA